jgi:hypothetical protein
MNIVFNCVGFIYMTCTMPMPSHTTTVVCPPLIEISADVQKRAREELLQLPPNSGLRRFVARSIEQRDVVRRCKVTKKKGW